MGIAMGAIYDIIFFFFSFMFALLFMSLRGPLEYPAHGLFLSHFNLILSPNLLSGSKIQNKIIQTENSK
jgi:hypothetical protein